MSATRYDPLQRAGGCSIPAPSRVRPAGRDLCAPGGQIYSHLGYWFTRGYLRGDSPVRMWVPESATPNETRSRNVGVAPHVPSKMIFRTRSMIDLISMMMNIDSFVICNYFRLERNLYNLLWLIRRFLIFWYKNWNVNDILRSRRTKNYEKRRIFPSIADQIMGLIIGIHEIYIIFFDSWLLNFDIRIEMIFFVLEYEKRRTFPSIADQIVELDDNCDAWNLYNLLWLICGFLIFWYKNWNVNDILRFGIWEEKNISIHCW